MKQLTCICFFLIFLNSNGQTTVIPDVNFEQALIDLGLDSGLPNGYVSTSAIDTVTRLFVPHKNINDLTGIQAFTSLIKLECYNNPLGEIDLSNNGNLEFVNCTSNNLSNLNLNQLQNLTTLYCGNNELSNLDVSQNLNLTALYCHGNILSSIDVSNNVNLFLLWCYGNQLMYLDLSHNPNLADLNCSNNQLVCININNGNNQLLYNDPELFITVVSAFNNPNLTCVQVDDPAAFSTYVNYVDASILSTDCGAMCTASLNEEIQQKKVLIGVYNLLGQKTEELSNELLIYKYSDGTNEKIFKLK